jgi:hypothetical protein
MPDVCPVPNRDIFLGEGVDDGFAVQVVTHQLEHEDIDPLFSSHALDKSLNPTRKPLKPFHSTPKDP